jgi:hypothetical protein
MRDQIIRASETVNIAFSDVANALSLLEERVHNPGEYSVDVAAMLDRHAFEAVRAAARRLESARDLFEAVKEEAIYELQNAAEAEAAVLLSVSELVEGNDRDFALAEIGRRIKLAEKIAAGVS